MYFDMSQALLVIFIKHGSWEPDSGYSGAKLATQGLTAIWVTLGN